MELSTVTALITGGASGLGAATAKAFADAGAKVILADLNQDAVAAKADELGAAFEAFDVSNAQAAEQAFDRIKADHGPVGVLVNCAGIAPGKRILGKEGPMPLSDFETAIRVNLIGTFNMMRLAASHMAERAPNDQGERGVVINTASIAAFEGQIGQAAYAASKGGVAGLTLPAAREFARTGIRVVAIAPGLFGTPMLLGLPQEVQDSLGGTVPFPARLGDPAEYAALASHIVANPMLNGEVIRLDGALRMQPK